MNINENTRTSLPEDIIELGVASADTHGPGEVGEFTGIALLPGISDD